MASSTVRKRTTNSDQSVSSSIPVQQDKVAPPPVPAAKLSKGRLYLKFFFLSISAICFGLAAFPILLKSDYASIDLFENPSIARLTGKGKADLAVFRSSLPFSLDTKSPASSVVRVADVSKQAAVREAFTESWSAYVEDAFGADEYHPISQSGSNFSADGGVGYFIIDTLDMLLILGEKKEFNRAKEWVRNVDWSSRRGKFSVFETTIRTLGGLLSAHALCQPGSDTLSPHTSQTCSPGDSEMFLEKAVELAERLQPAFAKSPIGIPLREVNFQTGESFLDMDNRGLSSLAEVASIQLEFKYLAQATGDQRWWTLAENPMKAIRKSAVKTQSEGLLPIFISPMTGDIYLSSIRLGSRGDSYYEYLIKQYVQTNHSEQVYSSMYQEAMKSVKKRLLKQSLQKRLLYTQEIEPRYSQNREPAFTVVPKQDHLVCFLGGSYMLGAVNSPEEYKRKSRVEAGEEEDDAVDIVSSLSSPPLSYPERLSSLAQEDLTIGHELIRTCVETYSGTSTGLAAEITMFRMINDSYSGSEPDWYIKRGPKEGTKTTAPLIDGRNILRPETVESLFIAFHLTGDEIYRNWGWQIFQAFVKSTKIRKGEKGRVGAFSSIRDVQAQIDQIEREDRMETFWLAETLKYLYLLFSDQDTLRLDQWVLNTEAHPLPVFQPSFDTTVTF